MEIKKIEFIKCNNTVGVNINDFEIWADGVIYNTLSETLNELNDIPAYIFKIKDKIIKDNQIVLTHDLMKKYIELQEAKKSYLISELLKLRDELKSNSETLPEQIQRFYFYGAWVNVEFCINKINELL